MIEPFDAMKRKFFRSDDEFWYSLEILIVKNSQKSTEERHAQILSSFDDDIVDFDGHILSIIPKFDPLPE
tara:strand:+ start:3373 stop:3582 length:210 start_codon:yes stop_codon:yes gene_type:complete